MSVPMSVAGNQARNFLRLLERLRPRWRSDFALPRFIQSLLTQDRSFGSRDRRLYRELIYTTLRYLPWIEPVLERQPDEALRRIAWLAADLPATRAFRVAFATGEPPGGDKSELVPAWFREHCPEIFHGAELETQLARAPLWLRVQTNEPDAVAREFQERGWRFGVSPVLAGAWRMLDEVDLTQSDAYRDGRIEVQDLGSQLLLETIGIESGTRWLDACAGAGGKTLQLARLVGEAGHVTAHDVRAEALGELAARVQRARLRNVAMASALRGEFDGVLVDAPCSGSGTWRRAPHLKWVTQPGTISRAAGQQRALFDQFSAHVRPGGRLVYATCSLSARENEEVVAAFLGAHPEFQPEPFARTFGAAARSTGLLLFPSLHDTDGFFVASLRRIR